MCGNILLFALRVQVRSQRGLETPHQKYEPPQKTYFYDEILNQKLNFVF